MRRPSGRWTWARVPTPPCPTSGTPANRDPRSAYRARNQRMPSPDSEIRERLRLELEQARAVFQDLVAAFSQQGWDAPSQNPNWTNGQLLFHIAFAFMLVPPLCLSLIHISEPTRLLSISYA